MIVWDEGAVEFQRDEPAHISFTLKGQKLGGGFGLIKTGERQWLLVKANDEQARAGSDVVRDLPKSVRSGRTWEELADDAA